MGERTALIGISVTVSGDVDLVDLALVDEEEEDPEEFEQKLEEMPHYVVKDMDGFFQVYSGFDAGEEEEIWKSAGDRDLIVFQDSSVYWADGENLIDGDGELIDEDSFSAEAEQLGEEVIE